MFQCPVCGRATISVGAKLKLGEPIIKGIVPERTARCGNCGSEIGTAGKNPLFLLYFAFFLSFLGSFAWIEGGDAVKFGAGFGIGVVLASLPFIVQLRKRLTVKTKAPNAD